MSDTANPPDGPDVSAEVPSLIEKPSLGEWLGAFLPFKIPRLALPQSAKNLDKVCSRLIEAGGDVGVSQLEHHANRRRALTTAELSYISAGSEHLKNPINSQQQQNALAYVINEAMGGASNRQKILEAAVEDLTASPPTQDAEKAISEDWLNVFAKIAAEKTDADMQKLWGKILAGEIRRPGSAKLRTLSELSMFDRDDALFAQSFLRNSISKQWFHLPYFEGKRKYDEIVQARELGLINDSGSMTYDIQPSQSYLLTSGSKALLISAKNAFKLYFPSTSSLTTLGVCLCGYLGNVEADEAHLVSLSGNIQNEHSEVFLVSFEFSKETNENIISSPVRLWPLS